MTDKDWPRLVITAFIMLLLLYAAWYYYSPGIEETIKAVVLIAVGYWLGSSKGSADKSTTLEQITTEPLKAEIVNTPDRPAQVEEVK